MLGRRVDLAEVMALVYSGVLAGWFGLAAHHKLRDRRGFANAIAAYPLSPRLRPVIARALPVIELLIAAGLIASPYFLAIAAPVLLVFVALLVSLLLRSSAVDCGCATSAFSQAAAKPSWSRVAIDAGSAIACVVSLHFVTSGFNYHAWWISSMAACGFVLCSISRDLERQVPRAFRRQIYEAVRVARCQDVANVVEQGR